MWALCEAHLVWCGGQLNRYGLKIFHYQRTLNVQSLWIRSKDNLHLADKLFEICILTGNLFQTGSETTERAYISTVSDQ